jgi:RHS repeat-associated protein
MRIKRRVVSVVSNDGGERNDELTDVAGNPRAPLTPRKVGRVQMLGRLNAYRPLRSGLLALMFWGCARGGDADPEMSAAALGVTAAAADGGPTGIDPQGDGGAPSEILGTDVNGAAAATSPPLLDQSIVAIPTASHDSRAHRDAPVALSTSATTAEDTPKKLKLAAQSSKPATLVFALEPPTHGSVTFSGPSSCVATSHQRTCKVTVVYTPQPDFNGKDHFVFTATAGSKTSNVATAAVFVTEVNDPPILVGDVAATQKGTPLTIPVATLLANDRPGPPNESSQTLAVTAVDAGADAHGTAVLADGAVTYTPDLGFLGNATLRYTACDNGTTKGCADPQCSTSTITITVAGADQPPQATPMAVTLAEDSSTSVTITGTDPDGDPLTFAVVSPPVNGTLSGEPPLLVYTPAPDYNGPDSFTFRANDGTHDSEPATVTIDVTEVNDPPVVAPDRFAVGAGEASRIPIAAVVFNDRAGPPNESAQHVAIAAVSVTADSHGTVVLDGTNIVYTPDPGFSGTATIAYELCDDGTTDGQPDPRCSSDGLITLDVVRPNRPPIADSQTLPAVEDVTRPITLTGSDPDGDALTYVVVRQPAHGALTGVAPDIRYVPAADYFGPDAFTFAVSDGRATSEPATIALQLAEVNDPPILGPDKATLGGVGALPPPPPRPSCGLLCGVLYGDPHMGTFDQGAYDFQAVGEFIAAKSTTDDFEVQVRTSQVPPERLVSIVTGVAMRVAGHRISLVRTPAGAEAEIDGVATTIDPTPMPLPGGGWISSYGTGDQTFVVWPDGSVVIAQTTGVFQAYFRFTVYVGLADARRQRMIGLLGNADGVVTNDLASRDSTFVLPYPRPPFSLEYPAYADSWRIRQDESLFDYRPGETTETFTDLTYPDAPVTADSLPPATRSMAANVCGVYGAVLPDVLDACIVDVGVTGDADFANGAAGVQGAVGGTSPNTGTTSIGTDTTVMIDAPGGTAVRSFAADAGQLVTLSVKDNGIGSVTLTVLTPSGTFLTNLPTSMQTAFLDAFTLPVTGTYTIVVAPNGQSAGSLTFEIGSTAVNTGSMVIGEPATVTIGTIGENAVRSFTATAGQKLTLTVTKNDIGSVTFTVRSPSGAFVTSLPTSETDAFSDTFTLPAETGTYTLTVDPTGPLIHSVTVELDSVPDNTGTMFVGTKTTVTIGTAGENAVRSFDATAGQKLTLTVTDNSIGSVTFTVVSPSGAFVTSFPTSETNAFSDTFTLPAETGTYTLTVDPRGQLTHSVTVELDSVPDNTGTMFVGTKTTVTIGTAGENAVRSFDATAGQKLTLTVTDNSIGSVTFTVVSPSGALVTSFPTSETNAFSDTFTLPAETGTYTLTVDPRGQLTHSVTVELDSVPDNTGSMLVGTETTVAIGTAGENAVRSFSGTAGQQLTLTMTGNSIGSVTLTVLSPTNGFVADLSTAASSAANAFALPATGTYTIIVDPAGQLTGMLTIELDAVAPAGAALAASLQSGSTRIVAAASLTATSPPTLRLAAAVLLANDSPGPANEANQILVITAVTGGPNSHGTTTFDGSTITYTPDAGFLGTATITYTACDNGTTEGLPDPKCSVGTITITVTANNPPVVNPQIVSTAEDAPVSITLTGTDADGDILAFAIAEFPAHGTLGGTAPNLVYTPAPDYNGPDSFSFTASDTHDESPPATVTITVTPVNDPPVPQPDVITYAAGQVATVSAALLLANDSPGPFNERTQTLGITAVSATADTHGAILLSAGTITYTPDAGFSGTAVVAYTVCDDGITGTHSDPQCAQGQLSLVANRAPVALAADVSTTHGSAATIVLAASDPEGDALDFRIATQPQHGAITVVNATVMYLPQSGFTGTDSFSFTASDAFSTSPPATVTIAVTATAPPTIRPDIFATTADTAVLVDVLANDSAGDGALVPATLAITSTPTNGTAVVESGAIRYTPAPGVTPDDKFGYRVCDTFGVCGAADVTIVVVVPDRPPIAVADHYLVNLGAALAVPAPGVLGNDSDPDPGDAIQALLDIGVSAGSLLLQSDGSFSYTPAGGFAGTDHFTYHAVDRAGLSSAPVTVTIDVAPPGPLAIDDEYTTTTDNPLTVLPAGVLANDRDLHFSDVLTAALSRAPFHGFVGLVADGSFVYTPDPGFTGDDSFIYSVTDVSGLATTARATLHVVSPPGPVPSIGVLTPAGGTRITAPTDITASITPPANGSIDRWSVVVRNLDRGAPSVLASGTGAPPATLARLDPTVLINGSYELLVRADAGGGGSTTAVADVVVTGDMKLGNYRTTFLDLEAAIHRFPVQVLRTYDSTDKRLGDFGVGWTLKLSSYRATPNNRLGQGGWSTEQFGFPFTRFRFVTSRPHFVTVTAPSGRVEIFDLVPAPTGPLLSLTTPQYVAREGSGTTSQLEDVDPPTLSITGTGDSLASFFGGEIYDPRLFRLTTSEGYALVIDRYDGLQSITDTNSNRLVFSARGVQSTATDQQLIFTRDGAGRIAELRGPLGNRTRYGYSKAGDLTSVEYANGATQGFRYDTQHHLLVTNGAGQVVRTLLYDESGRLTAITDGNGNTSRVAADVPGRQVVFTDPTGRLTTRETYDDGGNLVQQDRVSGGKTITTRATYNEAGWQLSATDPLGHTTSQTFDASGNVLATADRSGHVTNYTYNAFSEPLTVTDPLGNVTRNTYDAGGNLTETEAADGGKTRFTYDSSGNILTITDPTDRVTTRSYDARGQLASITDPGGNTTQVTVDAEGHVTSVVEANGGLTAYAFDAHGNLVQVIDPKGHLRSVTYDNFDRLVSVTDAMGRADLRTYDGAGNLTSLTDRDGRTSTYAYDAASRLVSKTVPGAGSAAYAYDGFGRTVSAVNDTAGLVLSYDDLDRVVSETSTPTTPGALPTWTFTSTYDANDNVTAVQGPSGSTAYTYDADSRLTQVTPPAGGSHDLGYDLVGRQTSLTRPNGVNDTISYDLAGNLTSLHSVLGSTLVNQADYAYNAAGRRSNLTTLAGTTSFGYDAVGRLTSASFPAGSGLQDEEYTYDTLGNRTSTVGSPVGSGTYDDANRLLGDGRATYEYDLEGNLLSRAVTASGATTTYTWSAEHQLVGIRLPDGSVTTYRYDPVGRRVEVARGASTSRFAYDGQGIAAEYDGSNTLVASYVHDPKSPTRTFVMTRDGELYSYLIDALGSTTALTTSTGATAASYAFDAFGKVVKSGSVTNPFTFAGQVFDGATGLYLFPLRAFDPTLGRFLSEDPLGSINQYPYCSNNPTNVLDPTGAADGVERTTIENRVLTPVEARIRRQMGWCIVAVVYSMERYLGGYQGNLRLAGPVLGAAYLVAYRHCRSISTTIPF